jgi:hypothetical protein
MNKLKWGEYDLHVLNCVAEMESEATPVRVAFIAKAILSLHERVSTLEADKTDKDDCIYKFVEWIKINWHYQQVDDKRFQPAIYVDELLSKLIELGLIEEGKGKEG